MLPYKRHYIKDQYARMWYWTSNTEIHVLGTDLHRPTRTFTDIRVLDRHGFAGSCSRCPLLYVRGISYPHNLASTLTHNRRVNPCPRQPSEPYKLRKPSPTLNLSRFRERGNRVIRVIRPHSFAGFAQGGCFFREVGGWTEVPSLPYKGESLYYHKIVIILL